MAAKVSSVSMVEQQKRTSVSMATTKRSSVSMEEHQNRTSVPMIAKRSIYGRTTKRSSVSMVACIMYIL